MNQCINQVFIELNKTKSLKDTIFSNNAWLRTEQWLNLTNFLTPIPQSRDAINRIFYFGFETPTHPPSIKENKVGLKWP